MKNSGLGSALGADNEGRVMSFSKQNRQRGKKEGHDEMLSKLIHPGTTIRLMMMSGQIMVGELAGNDRFTISLREAVILSLDEDGETIWQKLTDDKRFVQVVYKHSIESFNLDVHGDKNLTRDAPVDDPSE